MQRWRRGAGPGLASALVALAALGLCLPLGVSAGGPAVQGLDVATVVGGLEVPWALAWAPDGRLLFTERPGRLRAVADGQLLPEPLAVLPASRATAEGGLMGLALAPDFASSGALYVYYTYDAADGPRNRVSRLELRDGAAGSETAILDDMPGARIHDGGVLAFGPDGKLYVGTGDAGRGARAQDLSSPSGKILRLNPDGTVPEDNPFPGSPVYSLGHRNVQGLAWQPSSGQLYAAEHGPTGENGWCCHDEINRIVPGGNYGWPEVTGRVGDPRFLDPLVESGEGHWPPGGLAFATQGSWAGDLVLVSLAGGQLWWFALSADGTEVVDRAQLIHGEYGRLRGLALE
jgi:glucose/arabinose dehydrogenase